MINKFQNGFDIIHNNFTTKLNDLKELINVFSYRYDLELNYADGMRKLYERNHKFLDNG
jgi:hypothetical protein